MTDSRIDAATLQVLTQPTSTPVNIDATHLQVLTQPTSTPSNVDGVYLSVLTSLTEMEPTYPSQAFWGMLQKFS